MAARTRNDCEIAAFNWQHNHRPRECGRAGNAHDTALQCPFRVGLCQFTAVSRGSCSNNSITLSVTVARTIVGLPETDQPEVCAGSFSGMAWPELMSAKFKVSRVWYAYP